jgi:hypothetical protein
LAVIVGVGNLVHYEVGVLEEAKHPIVEFDAHVIFVLLEAEGTEEQVLHPMVVEVFDEAVLYRETLTKFSDSMMRQSSIQQDQR